MTRPNGCCSRMFQDFLMDLGSSSGMVEISEPHGPFTTVVEVSVSDPSFTSEAKNEETGHFVAVMI